MARHLDDSLVEFLEDLPDRIQHVEERRPQIRAVGRESYVARHVQCDVVAHARDAHARARELFAQLGFLAVHVMTDGATGQRAYARADQRTLAPFDGIVTGDEADDGTCRRADQRALCGTACLGLARVGIQSLAARKQHGRPEYC